MLHAIGYICLMQCTRTSHAANRRLRRRYQIRDPAIALRLGAWSLVLFPSLFSCATTYYRPCLDSGIRVTAPPREGRKEGENHIKTSLTPSRPWSPIGDQDRASRATAFSAIVQLRRPRHFDSPPTQHHAYPSRSSRQSSRMRRDEPVSIR